MIRYLFLFSLVASTLAAPAAAAEFGTKEEAVPMVKRVQAQFKKDGAEATFKDVSDKSTKAYHDRGPEVLGPAIDQRRLGPPGDRRAMLQ